MTPDQIELRSEEVQEILGTPPHWLVRWGTYFFFIISLIVTAVAFFMPYNETAQGNISVTSTDPPKRLIAENGGYISEILVLNEDTVRAGEPLLVFKCKANFEDALLLELIINSIPNADDSSLLNLILPKNLLLGELQDDYYDFLRKQETFNYMYGGNLEQLNVIQLEKKIQTIQSSLQLEQRRKSKLAEQLDLAFTRQSQEEMNVENRLLDPEILSQTKEDILQLEREMQVIEGNIKDKQFEIETVRSNISGVKTEASENLFSASSQMKDAFVKLRNSLKDWKKSYLVTAPIDGIVLYANEKIGEQQFVSREAELLMVVPLNRIETIGRMMVPVSKSAKIEEHQKVVVRLDGYPQYEYGIVEGEVMWKGIVPNNGDIPVEIRFPNGLTTSTGEEIEPKQAMSGNADVILAEKRLIQRIFETARNLSF